MPRDELNAQERAELAALDRILAREDPVDETHLELAALVDSVRAQAPRIHPDYAAGLEAAFAARLAERGRARTRARGALARARAAREWRSMRAVALAAGSLAAAGAALAVVLSSGVLGGPGGRSPRPIDRVGASQAPAAPAQGAPGAGAATGVPSGSSSSGFSPVAPIASAPSRLVARGSVLVLRAPAATMQRVANAIVADTERHGGTVASSQVDLQGAASLARFSLRVPSHRLASLIGALASLAGVDSLRQGTRDVTGAYDRARAALAARRAERGALLESLARSLGTPQETAMRHRLGVLERIIAGELRGIDAQLASARTATLQVTVRPAAATRHGAAAAGPLARASRAALHALVEILAIALIVLAIMLPFALSALALWWSVATLRARSRERALGSA